MRPENPAGAPLSIPLRIGAALIFLILPPETLDQIQAGIDSAQTVTRSQQLEELGRRGVDPAVAERITNPSPSINIWVGIFGGMIAVGFLGTMAGSAGWAATFLIAGALGGRWPWRGDPSSIVPGERA